MPDASRAQKIRTGEPHPRDSKELLEAALGATPALKGTMNGVGRRFVYILRSGADANRHYVGISSNVEERVGWHNAGLTRYTVALRPWSLVVSIEFPTERQAFRFEKYLKSRSGRAFAKRHFDPRT